MTAVVPAFALTLSKKLLHRIHKPRPPRSSPFKLSFEPDSPAPAAGEGGGYVQRTAPIGKSYALPGLAALRLAALKESGDRAKRDCAATWVGLLCERSAGRIELVARYRRVRGKAVRRGEFRGGRGREGARSVVLIALDESPNVCAQVVGQTDALRCAEEEKVWRLMRRPGAAVGESRETLAVFGWVVRAAALSDLPALVTGETGTGKEVLVRRPAPSGR